MQKTDTKGQIVVVTSVAKNGVPFQSAYCGAKSALHGAFTSIRLECRSQGINVLFIVPGPVESRVSENAFTATVGQRVGENKVIDKRMSAERTSRIMAVAMANRQTETWIAQRPYNLLIYADQYLPTVSKLITVPMLEKRLKEYKKKFNKSD
jgi:dehydrogenase/reductase SDR family protein 7